MTDENEDVKNGKVTPPENDQLGEDDQDNKSETSETLETLKAENARLKEERDNYKAGLLKKKGEEKLNKGKEENTEEEDPKKIDPTIVASIVDERLSSDRKKLQKRALDQFIDQYKIQDEATLNGVLANLHLTGDEILIDDYHSSFRKALLLHKADKGELESFIEAEKKRTTRQAQIDAEVKAGMNAGNNGDGRHMSGVKPTLSPKGEEIARGMKVDPEKSAKIDIHKDNVISIV